MSFRSAHSRDFRAVKAFGGAFDVSHNNGIIGWRDVPVTYRLIFAKASQGTGFKDPQFDANLAGGGESGHAIVPYHFLTSAPADAQVKWFAQSAHLKSGQAAMIDWESNDPRTLPPTAIVESVVKGLQDLLGRNPLVYHGIYVLASRAINACPWHIPKYGPAPDPARYKWLFWQDSPTARVRGVPSAADHDWFNGTEAELMAWFQTGALPAAVRNFHPTEES